MKKIIKITEKDLYNLISEQFNIEDEGVAMLKKIEDGRFYEQMQTCDLDEAFYKGKKVKLNKIDKNIQGYEVFLNSGKKNDKGDNIALRLSFKTRGEYIEKDGENGES